jgi:hypothetical protein
MWVIESSATRLLPSFTDEQIIAGVTSGDWSFFVKAFGARLAPLNTALAVGARDTTLESELRLIPV